MPYRPRQMRDSERVHRARTSATGRSAIESALAQIDAAFDEAAAINAVKVRIEHLVRLGPHHRALRARFAPRADLLSGRSLAAAITQVERWWRAERKAFQIASALGYGNRLSLEVLGELRLILRLMRFKRMNSEFCAFVDALNPAPIAVAAE